MAAAEERIARLESERENEHEWRHEILARLGRLESNQRWIIGLLIAMLLAVIGGMGGIIASL